MKGFNPQVLKYLRGLHKSQYNLILLSLIIQNNEENIPLSIEPEKNTQNKSPIQKKEVGSPKLKEIKEQKTLYNEKSLYGGGSNIKTKKDGVLLKETLIDFCFNKLDLIRRPLNGALLQNLDSSRNERFSGLYKEKSPIMQDLEEVFLLERLKCRFSLNILKYNRDNNTKVPFLMDFGFLELSSESCKRFLSIYNELNEILTIRYLENSEFSLDNELLAKKALQINIKGLLFKEIALMLGKDTMYCPFNQRSFQQEIEGLNKKLGLYSRMFNREKKIKILINSKGKVLELSRFLWEEDHLKIRLDFLSNEIEKAIIKDSIRFYLITNQVYSLFISQNNFQIELVSNPTKLKGKAKEISINNHDPIENLPTKPFMNPILRTFLNKVLSSSSMIEVFKVGKGLVVPMKGLKEDIAKLNASFLNFFLYAFHQVITPLFQQELSSKFSCQIKEQSNRNLLLRIEFLGKNFSEIVESEIAKKSSDLLFSLDHLYKFLNYMKDEEALREQEIKKLTRNEFSERIVDKKNDINIINSRFEDYKTGMNYDLTKYIEEAKTEAEKMIQKRNAYRPSFLKNFTQIFKSLNIGLLVQEKGRNEVPEAVRLNDKAKLYKSFRRLRVFYILRHQVLKQKHQRNLEQKNQKFISSEILWNKIKGLEKNEGRIKEALIGSEKQIAILEHQNLILKGEVRSITLEKVQLYKANNLQRGQLLELEENFAILRRKKFIENEDPEVLVKVITKPMNSAKKLLRQQTEFFSLNESSNLQMRSSSMKKLVDKSEKEGKKERFGTFKAVVRKKKLFEREKPKEWDFKSELFVKKSFKITIGGSLSKSNLNFYGKKE